MATAKLLRPTTQNAQHQKGEGGTDIPSPALERIVHPATLVGPVRHYHHFSQRRLFATHRPVAPRFPLSYRMPRLDYTRRWSPSLVDRRWSSVFQVCTDPSAIPIKRPVSILIGRFHACYSFCQRSSMPKSDLS